MTIAQASRKTGIRNCYIQLYCQHGILPARQDVVSGAWDIPEQWLDSFIAYYIMLAGGDIERARHLIYRTYHDRVLLHGNKCDVDNGDAEFPTPPRKPVINKRLENTFARNRKRRAK